MSVTYRAVAASPQDVFDVLADGWLYVGWVVGTARIRGVDADWPQPESRLHHSVGLWPFMLEDTTSMVEWDPPRRAVLRARGWPIGEAHVTIDVKRRGDGCVVRLNEDAVEGPGRFVPSVFRQPVIHVRNKESLQRLAYLAEGHAGRT
ncbi:Polyketide cyclase / dehydrase and lipid transport [Paramicrobacterium humi]|uniref:Polyketide cyclase / dehydrase and lipid transport n=1 Tax=Paramicrobacterium humi TaxID=640635 RepID=A0A1H4LX80_9MICO|nr:SRPBCC family protein [Microbacterium humi]SEB75301.1 Polyketide cyclase / dehydrase and lipid transport [Microbacterium humi]